MQYQDFAMDNNLVDFNIMRKQIKGVKVCLWGLVL